MRSVQFKVDDSRYNKAKKKLIEAGTTWQTVAEQMIDQIIMSEDIDEFGLPLQEMSPSVIKKATSEIEGHFETAAQKYIQIQIEDHGRNRNHWMQALRGALKNVIKSNSSKGFKRGYFFSEAELSKIFKEMWPNGLKIAAGHLVYEEDQ